MEKLRRQVTDLLDTKLPAPGGKRVKGSGVAQGVIHTLGADRGDDPDYLLRRLKRDDPAMAGRVLAGEVTDLSPPPDTGGAL